MTACIYHSARIEAISEPMTNPILNDHRVRTTYVVMNLRTFRRDVPVTCLVSDSGAVGWHQFQLRCPRTGMPACAIVGWGGSTAPVTLDPCRPVC